MAASSRQQFDDTGKVVFDDYYVQPDPRPYFTSVLDDLDYRIPGEVKPVFRQMIEALRRHREQTELTVVDLGCSYGINASLLKTDLTMDDLYEHYGAEAVAEIDRDQLLEHDRRFYSEHQTDPDLTFVGIDAAEPAVRYATDAGLLETGVVANLEETPLSAIEREAVSGADLVISTGAIGYLTERTVAQVLEAAGARRPSMAHCVLRMFSFAPFEAMLRSRDYVVEQFDGTLPQRKFANEDEQAHVLENLERRGIDPTDKEAEGWCHANVYIARPV